MNVVKPMLYANLQEVVDPSHTCLVLWDVQNALVNAIFNKEQFLQNLKLLVETARKKKVPLSYTKITPLPLRYESAWNVYMLMKRAGVDRPDKLKPWIQLGSPEAEIHSVVGPAEGDIVIKKHTASIFIGTHFESMMRNAGISTLLFTGIATEWGIDSNAREASNRGFYTVVISDCVSSTDKQMHDFTLAVLQRVCLVMPSVDIIAEWK
jgi:nicotinamidase-related amidase